MRCIIRKAELPHVLYFSLSQLDVGGIETHILELLKGLDGYKVSLAGLVTERFKRSAEHYGAQVYPLPPVHKYDLNAIRKYAALFRELEVDIVHTQDARGGLLGRIAARLAGCKAVHTVHISSLFWNPKGLKRLLHRGIETVLARLFTDRMIFVARPIMQWYLNMKIVPANKVCYIPNGIDLKFLREAKERGQCSIAHLKKSWGIDENESVVLFVGRLSFEKGLDNLIEAFARVLRHYPKTHLVLVGDGPEKESLAHRLASLNLEKHVTMTGSRPYSEVIQWLALSTVFILPSRFECMPYTLLEAMAVGLPCIASRVGGNVDLIEDGKTGLLVEPDDIEGLSQAICKLIDNAGLREYLGENARQRVQEFTVERMVTQTSQTYKEVLGGVG